MQKILINLLLLLGGLILGLVVCEVGIRALGRYFPKVAFLTSIGKESVPLFADTLEEYVKTPGYLLYPHGRYIGCKTNSLGFYDEEFSQENTQTIAVGDSYLFGRVAYPDNVVTRLETELSGQCGLEKKFPIANFGIAGLQPRDYLEVIRLVLKKYKPKTILLHLYLGNDFPQVAFLDHLLDGLPKPQNFFSKYFTSHFELFRLYDNLKRVIGTEINQPDISEAVKDDTQEAAGTCRPLNDDERKFLNKNSFASAEWFKIILNEAGRFYPGKEGPEELIRVRQKFVEPLTEIAKLCKEHDVRVIAILSPSQFPLRPDLKKWFFQKMSLEGMPLSEEKFDWDLPNKASAKILENLGIEFVDITPYLRDKMDRDRKNPYYAPGDTHWNETGNKAAAEIAGNLLKPLLCPH